METSLARDSMSNEEWASDRRLTLAVRAPTYWLSARSWWDFLDSPDRFAVAWLAGRVREVVQCLLPAPTLVPVGFVGEDPGDPERKPDRARSNSNNRQHSGPRPSSGSRRKRGAPRQGFDRSRGGFTTTIHHRVNGAGRPWGGKSHRAKHWILIADQACRSDKVRKTMEARNVVLVILMRKYRRLRVVVGRAFYRLRNLVERCFNKLKNAAALPTAMTRLSKATSASSTSHRSACGSAICQH